MDPALLAFLLSPLALALFGLCVGSFLNVVAHRLPIMLEAQWCRECAELLDTAIPDKAQARLNLARPRSRCPACGHVLHWYENIPLIGWLALRGRCSACKTTIGWRYPLVELATGALFGVLAWQMGPHPTTLLWCGFVAALLVLALIDWDTTLLPDSITQPLLWSGLIAAAMGWNLRLPDALWGAIAGYLSLWTVTWLFKLATGKVGMGNGDFKLLAALAAWLGPSMIIPVVLGASMLGAVVGIGMKATGQLREGRFVPFGPFLAGAGLVVLIAGQDTVSEWLGWY